MTEKYGHDEGLIASFHQIGSKYSFDYYYYAQNNQDVFESMEKNGNQYRDN